MNDKVIYLMRGLPSSGKSYTARKIAGSSGIVLETDEFFYSQVGTDSTQYDYQEDLLPQARRWNYARFEMAVVAGRTPIVVDRGNGWDWETKRYARLGIGYGYSVELKEPESEWWQEIRILLKYKHLTGALLDQWAVKLADKNLTTHRVPPSQIRRWMDAWKHDVTVEDILSGRAA